jgi:hypothetical protein
MHSKPRTKSKPEISQAMLERIRQESIIKSKRLSALRNVEAETRQYALAALEYLDVNMRLCGKFPTVWSPSDVCASGWRSISRYPNMQGMTHTIANRVLDVLQRYVERPEYLGEIFEKVISDPAEIEAHWNERMQESAEVKIFPLPSDDTDGETKVA